MVFAAIDIGSNAIRLLICNVFEDENGTVFRKHSLTRVPIRLGDDAFLSGRISTVKSVDLIKAMIAFKHLLEIHHPLAYIACATSAIRTAENGPRIIEEVRRRTNLEIEIIDGQWEAEIIYATHIAEQQANNNSYLYIEVGGGSTELSLFSRNRNVCSRSFPIGTVRLLHNLVEASSWEQVKAWLQENTAAYRPIVGIGTGGNINTILKMLRRKEGKSLSVRKLKEVVKNLRSFSVEDRVKVLGLRADRADVIIPATDIYLSVMKWAGISRLIVPKIGLADGLIHVLYERYKAGKNQPPVKQN